MTTAVQISQISTRRELKAFVTFPWKVYKGDRNWVPPLIADRMEYLSPKTGPFYAHADVAQFVARRDGQVVGTIAPFVDHRLIERIHRPEGGFGFFEVMEDYEAAEALMDAAADWLRARGMALMRGPTSFTDNDLPGVLIDGADCPPAMLEAHTPPYYRDFMERYGMEKDHDLYAWRAFRSQIGEGLKNLPPQLSRVAEVARRVAGVTIRKIDMQRWDEELAAVYHLFQATLFNTLERASMTEAEWGRMAGQLKSFIDPDLALLAEVKGKPVGFCVALPDINQVLIHLNGRLFPLGWLEFARRVRQVKVVTFKMVGVLPEYRRRGIDALLYMDAVKAVYDKGYEWLDGSVTDEHNDMVNRIASRLGAERYKHWRVYRKKL